MTHGLNGRSIVVTGASSGIGRAAVQRLVGDGANVVGFARRKQMLAAMEADLAGLPGRFVSLAGDVADQRALDDAAALALGEFGTLDVWVNNAGVAAFGALADTPNETYERLFDTNVLGYVHGIRAALPQMRAQGRGVIINNASIVARIGASSLSAYTASKWAVRGLTECLRQELRDDGIEVCALLPGTIDTSIWSTAANYSGRCVDPRMTISPDRVAEDIVSLIERPRRERITGRLARLQVLLYEHFPEALSRAMKPLMENVALGRADAARTDGSVFKPLTQDQRRTP